VYVYEKEEKIKIPIPTIPGIDISRDIGIIRFIQELSPLIETSESKLSEYL
jgi:hypothetical protein